MKVLHVINSLSGSGGAEHGLVREVTRFGSGLEQIVVRLYSQDALAADVVRAGIVEQSLGLDSSRSGWNWPLGTVRLSRVIRGFRPDVIHSSLFSANLVAQLATRRHNIPVLSTFTLSGDEVLLKAYQPGADTRRASLLRRIGGMAARADNVWFRALSADALETNANALGVDTARGVIIPRGVPLPDPASPVLGRSELGLPPEVPVLLNVGRQTAQKGHALLIRTLEILRRSRPAHLVILGREGDETPALRKAIHESDVRDHVTVIPYTDRTYAYYRQADVFVFSSLMEGLGTAVLEAMANRVPVVAFDIAPVREATKDGTVARLVPLGDAELLADAVTETLREDSDVHRLVDGAFDWVSREHSIDRIAELVRKRLEEVAAAHR